VWQRFGARLAAGEFDVVHRITPLSPTAVGPLAARCRAAGVPVVLGPLNGGVPWPAAFDAARRQEREWLSYVRGAYKALPGRTRMLGAATAILAGSRHTLGEIPQRFRDRAIYMPENGLDPARFNRTAMPPPAPPLRACFIGRLVPYKGPDMLLEAAAPLLREGRLRLEIVGDGPLGPELRAQAGREGIADAVAFHGQVPHDRVQDIAAACHLLAFPSIREFGGGVVLEAMALGVVPLVVDYAGPGELVSDATGLRLPLGPRDGIVAALRERLSRLCADPSGLPALAAAGQAQVRALFTWEAKAGQVCEVYDWVTGRRRDKPSFAFPG
jgi:glycosyltransferase involved in cell wall biosynthesis